MSARVASAVILGVAVLATPLGAQESVVLRVDPPAGRISHQLLETRTWMVQGDAAPIDTASPFMIMRMFTTQSVAAADSGVRVITAVVDSVQMVMGGGMPMPGDLADWMKGMTTTQRVNDDGDVISMTAAPGPGTPPELAGRMPDLTGPAGHQVYPRRALHVGDTWTDTSAVPVAPGGTGAATVIYTFTLVKIESRDGDQLATIVSRGATTIPADSTGAVGFGDDFTMETVVNVTQRRVVRMTFDGHMHLASPLGPMTSVVRTTVRDGP